MRAFAFAMVLAAALSAPSCVGGSIHGLDEQAWFRLLAAGEPLPIRSGAPVDYDALARLGPGAYLFLAIRANEGGDASLGMSLLREAVSREEGRYKTRAAALLAEGLLSAGDGDGLVAFCRSETGGELPPYRRSYLEARGLAQTGAHAQVLAAIDALRSAHPREARNDAPELAAMAVESGYRSGRGRWANEFSALVAMDGSPAVYQALARVVRLVESSSRDEAAAAIRAVGPRAFQLAEARALSGARSYGPAVVAFRRYALGAETPEAVAARVSALPPMTVPPPEEPTEALPGSVAPTPPVAAATSPAQTVHPETAPAAATPLGPATPASPTTPSARAATTPDAPAAMPPGSAQAGSAQAGSADAGTGLSSRPLSAKAAAGLFLELPRAAASDAARAFMDASREEGAGAFRHLAETALDRGADPERSYFDAFWHGRFLRAAEQWAAAEAWFAKAAIAARSGSERDAARWYEVEAAWKRSGPAAIPLLGRAVQSSANPGYFADLIEPLSREALVARNGAALAALDASVSAKAAARDAARLAYLCARAAQAGIIRETDIWGAFGDAFGPANGAAEGDGRTITERYAEARLRAAYAQRADAWYRLAAAYRLGEPLVDPLAAEAAGLGDPAARGASEAAPATAPSIGASAGGSAGATAPASAPAAAPGSAAPGSAAPGSAAPVSADSYALALARFGLGAKARSELGTEFSSLAWDTVRSISETLAGAGRHDQAYRLIATLFWKSDFSPTRRDAELYWPRPYPEDFAEATLATGLDAHLFYGLARSESAFDPAALSRSGAVGLTQLMPATAAETAARLKIRDYELEDPSDNLTIGSAYFARLLTGVGGRVLPAVFSYNGGPTRFRRWEAEYGALPLDLLLEALSYAETRQYGRNVAHAALSYAALYGEGDLRGYFAWLIGEGPRP